MTLLDFVNKYYDFLDYDDEVILQMSFRNVKNFIITGFNQINGRREWRPFFNEIPKNTTHNNYKINYPFVPSSLNEKRIIEIAKEISEQILLAHGVNDMSACFVDDKLDVNLFSHIRYLG